MLYKILVKLGDFEDESAEYITASDAIDFIRGYEKFHNDATVEAATYHIEYLDSETVRLVLLDTESEARQ